MSLPRYNGARYGSECWACNERRAAPRLPTYRSDPAPAWRTTTPVERGDVIIVDSISSERRDTKAKPAVKKPVVAKKKRRKPVAKKEKRPTAWDRILDPVLQA